MILLVIPKMLAEHSAPRPVKDPSSALSHGQGPQRTSPTLAHLRRNIAVVRRPRVKKRGVATGAALRELTTQLAN